MFGLVSFFSLMVGQAQSQEGTQERHRQKYKIKENLIILSFQRDRMTALRAKRGSPGRERQGCGRNHASGEQGGSVNQWARKGLSWESGWGTQQKAQGHFPGVFECY